jgi:hypothetical protein
MQIAADDNERAIAIVDDRRESLSQYEMMMLCVVGDCCTPRKKG